MSKVIFKTKRVVVIHGDSVPLIPMLRKKKVTAIIADPPYGIGYGTKVDRTKGFGTNQLSAGTVIQANKYDSITNDDKPFDPIPWVDFDKVVLFGANNFLVGLPPLKGWLVWDKNGGRDFAMDQGDAELAWTKGCTGAVRIYRQLWRGVVRDTKGEPKGSAIRVYPAQKPVGLFYWIIKRFTKLDDIICDPYMGSGTTLLAALKAGRRCIGIDITRKACDIAVERLRDSDWAHSLPLTVAR